MWKCTRWFETWTWTRTIVSYFTSPFPCTDLRPIPMQCQYTLIWSYWLLFKHDIITISSIKLPTVHLLTWRKLKIEKLFFEFSPITGCGGDLHAQEGTIESPNHPQRYPNNTECVWQINVNNGYHVNLNFLPPFELEIQEPCSGDFVEVSVLMFWSSW